MARPVVPGPWRRRTAAVPKKPLERTAVPIAPVRSQTYAIYIYIQYIYIYIRPMIRRITVQIEGHLEVKLPTLWKNAAVSPTSQQGEAAERRPKDRR